MHLPIAVVDSDILVQNRDFRLPGPVSTKGEAWARIALHMITGPGDRPRRTPGVVYINNFL